jgi:hypothetical protein
MPQVTSLFLALHPPSFLLPPTLHWDFTSQHLSASTYSAVGSTLTKFLVDYLEHYYINIPLTLCQELFSLVK